MVTLKEKKRAVVMGATGMVGQRFIQLLADHPWFEVVGVAASERSSGRPYGEAARWIMEGPVPQAVADMTVLGLDDAFPECDFAFSALPSSVAGEIEEKLAAAGVIVCSNASAHRMTPDVPLIIPEVNPDHMDLLDAQRRKRGWEGGIFAAPNCTSNPLTIALKPLHDAFGVKAAHVVSMQAVSGKGYPNGEQSLDIIDNVLPYVPGEESKVQSEPLKVLGTLEGSTITPAPIAISAMCNRVAVRNGHMICVAVQLEKPVTVEEAIAAWESFDGGEAASLPSAPKHPVTITSQPNRPQPVLDRDLDGGMTTVIGRIARKKSSAFDLQFVALSHNTLRGAAKGALLNAELYVMREMA